MMGNDWLPTADSLGDSLRSPGRTRISSVPPWTNLQGHRNRRIRCWADLGGPRLAAGGSSSSCSQVKSEFSTTADARGSRLLHQPLRDQGDFDIVSDRSACTALRVASTLMYHAFHCSCATIGQFQPHAAAGSAANSDFLLVSTPEIRDGGGHGAHLG